MYERYSFKTEHTKENNSIKSINPSDRHLGDCGHHHGDNHPCYGGEFGTLSNENSGGRRGRGRGGGNIACILCVICTFAVTYFIMSLIYPDADTFPSIPCIITFVFSGFGMGLLFTAFGWF